MNKTTVAVIFGSRSSEHDVSLVSASNVIANINTDIYDIVLIGITKEGKWLAENCYKFGFIIRYPKNKTEITGISWEPWHIRYVGRYHATKMYELDMCLEEYLVYIGKN